MQKKVLHKTYAHEFQMGSIRVKQPLPTHDLEQVSPFILLHHAGPMNIAPGSRKFRIDPHPHKGFEPVTLLFEGKLLHRDSIGNTGRLNAGDVQWMTAGRGIVHSEGPPDEFFTEGGTLELIQLWINIPAKNKLSEPKYQDIPKHLFPKVLTEIKGLDLDLITGDYEGKSGPASTFSKQLNFKGGCDELVNFSLKIPENYNSCVYVLSGELLINGKQISARELSVFSIEGSELVFECTQAAKFVVLSGLPINEPMVSHGPFVMNTEEELRTAFAEYRSGKMGFLEE